MLLSERLDRMVVTASTPDGAIAAELYDRDQVRLSFPGGYRWLDESRLPEQLAALGRILWARRMREFFAILSEDEDVPITGEPEPATSGQREFVERRAELVARGESADGRVALSVRGMQEWTVRVQPGTVRECSEEEFATAVRSAVTRLLDDQARQITELKIELGDRLD
ncbi:MAG: hypothetical protein HOU81_23085 [Hamadaea sp.]|uniref:hypothetical protein n=1 Tax=Hamadaea sp. TaxID=2024425 RepID=UPI001803CAB1|nr:hypothetical protein [Hamadaea sp.]NUR73710.1 hypothetical protein [Hamadaea sp.]NUT22560.1 hypothetical protein [Hamadaea sp.]